MQLIKKNYKESRKRLQWCPQFFNFSNLDSDFSSCFCAFWEAGLNKVYEKITKLDENEV